MDAIKVFITVMLFSGFVNALECDKNPVTGECGSQTVEITDYIKQYCVVDNPNIANNYIPCTSCSATLTLFDMKNRDSLIYSSVNMTTYGSGLFVYPTEYEDFNLYGTFEPHFYTAVIDCILPNCTDIIGNGSDGLTTSCSGSVISEVKIIPPQTINNGSSTDSMANSLGNLAGYFSPSNAFNNFVNKLTSLTGGQQSTEEEGGTIKKTYNLAYGLLKNTLDMGDDIKNILSSIKELITSPASFILNKGIPFILTVLWTLLRGFFLLFMLVVMFIALYSLGICHGNILIFWKEFISGLIKFIGWIIDTLRQLAQIIAPVIGWLVEMGTALVNWLKFW